MKMKTSEFCEKYFNIKLLPYQKILVDSIKPSDKIYITHPIDPMRYKATQNCIALCRYIMSTSENTAIQLPRGDNPK